MFDERSLKAKGEDLARVSVESNLGFKQLSTIYKITKTRPLSFVEAFIQRQIGRRVQGFDVVGEVLLELLREFTEDKAAFQKVLMYANMLYDYYEKKSEDKLKGMVEEVVKKVVDKYGFLGLEISSRRGFTQFEVELARFYDDPRVLSSQIERTLRQRVPEVSNLNFRVWIKKSRR